MTTFSLCMIVKNEEAVLKRCLDSFKNAFDEIIVVDTGSTDNTKLIAKEYTDKIYDFAWTGSFSDARNYAFSKASCDYIYSCDADEVLEPSEFEKLVLLKRAMMTEIEIVQMYYVTPDEYNTVENFKKDLRPKLYKRLRTFTWIDPVHESVNLNPVVFDSDIEIKHLPVNNHSGRDFAIFEKMFDNNTYMSSKLVMMYARELLISGKEEDLINAISCFEAIANDENRSQDDIKAAYCVLAKAYRILDEADNFFKIALKDMVTGACSEVCHEIGNYYRNHGNTAEADIWFYNAEHETQPAVAILNKNN